MKKFFTIDLVGGAAALVWAGAAQAVPEMNNIVSWEAAGTFALMALARWFYGFKRNGHPLPAPGAGAALVTSEPANKEAGD